MVRVVAATVYIPVDWCKCAAFKYRGWVFVITMKEQKQTVADQLEDDVLQQLESAQNATNPINQIKRRIDEDDTTRGFSIARIPTEAHEDFKTLAKSMFADDYGMTLAFLVHYFKITDGHNEQFQEVADNLEARMDTIETLLKEQGETDEHGHEVDTLQ